MSLIGVSGLTYSYEGSYDNVFENVTLNLDTDWRLGLIGRNGKGKTTFLRLLTGELDDGGAISAKTEFEYFPYEIRDKSLTGIEIAYELCPDCEYWQIVRELSLLEVDDEVLSRSFDSLSGGEQTKLMLALLFLRPERFLLIDEPTNHLDARARETVGRYLSRKKGFILVSHDRTLLDRCCDHILSINRTTIELTAGNYSVWDENRRRREQFELAENERLLSDIKRLEKAAKRTADWSDKAESKKIGFDPTKVEKSLDRRAVQGRKAQKMMDRAKAISKRRQDAVEEKSRLLKDLETAQELKISPLAYRSARLAQFEDISLFYGENRVCSGVGFAVERGERTVLSGRNGCGKSSLLRLLCGEDIKYTGTLTKPGDLVISYVPQDTSFLCGSLDDFAAERGIDISLFKAILRKLGFSREQFSKDMSDFSAGQKKKTLIAASLSERAHLYIWDEPLNYIDLFSREQIEQLICRFAPTMLLVEHDSRFCEIIGAKEIEIKNEEQ
ncbi:MAG: ABC-F type ribosomal protection protein [Clostridia bacterium]|nr:ABC-F type ribosomal protection protein [Oscillospiraceae bacterium]MBQ6797051.1 ABC-F type ribosomal protection protein [Clostridia bacterium]